ncbi:MAG: acyltransferase family protein [Paludibacteraceae bacterium]|nr:acyltransferase family protein [Paludibacteraceae bacterium]
MERNKALDATKYLLIVLVVVGHFIEPSRYSNPISCCLYCVIYSFHMPLFVMISGYLFKQRKFSEEIKKCVPLLEVCLLSHFGFLLIQHGLNISIRRAFFFGDPAWYLLCLIYWRISTSILQRRFKAKHIFALAILLDLISFCVIKHGCILSVSRAISFYPFFLLGYCLKDKMELIFYKYKNLFLIFGGISLVVVIFTASVLQFKTAFHAMSVFDLKQFTDMNTLAIFAYRYVLLMCALSIGGMFYLIVHSNSFLLKFSEYGKNTLFIYLIQSWALAITGKFEIPLWLSLCMALVAIPVFTYLSQQRYASYIMHPVSCVLRLA